MPIFEILEVAVPTTLSAPLFLFLGFCVGSFLNVVIYRIEAGVRERAQKTFNITTPPSHCPLCKHFIAWYDNIPVISWIILRGRCRNCTSEISIKYPLVELSSGLILMTVWIATKNVEVWISAAIGWASILPMLWWVIQEKKWHFHMYIWCLTSIILSSIIYIWTQN